MWEKGSSGIVLHTDAAYWDAGARPRARRDTRAQACARAYAQARAQACARADAQTCTELTPRGPPALESGPCGPPALGSGPPRPPGSRKWLPADLEGS